MMARAPFARCCSKRWTGSHAQKPAWRSCSVLLAKSEIADLYLSGRTLATRANGNVLLHPLAEDWAASLRACLAEMPKRRWRIWLGGSRCELHLCEPISGVRSIEE